jgi:putative photosynthetic complex assembly protein 2
VAALAAAAGYALVLWWFSTGVILFLNHLSPRSFRWSMSGATVVLIAALIETRFTASVPTVTGAYVGFTCGVLAWAWHEMSFFMGYVTGPRRTAGPEVHGWRRFRHAAQTCQYHEIAIALTALAILLLSAHRPNQIALWTFLSLWVMRLSAKFNLFLGVRNLNEQFVPRRIAYLTAYMRRRRMNALLPFSIAAGATAAALFALHARQTTQFTAAGDTLVAALLALAVLEHAVMVLPLPFETLWSAFTRCPVDHAALHIELERRTLRPSDQSGLSPAMATCPPLACPMKRS